MTTPLRAQSLDPRIESYDLLERVKAGLRSARGKALFPKSVSLAETTSITVLTSTKAGERTLLDATTDIRWNVALGYDPNEQGEGMTIEQVDGGEVIPGTLE